MVESLHPCRCQKQPRMSIIVLAPGMTISGRPGKRLSHTRYRQPHANRRLRTIISGKVSLPRIFAITRLRCSFVMRSILCPYLKPYTLLAKHNTKPTPLELRLLRNSAVFGIQSEASIINKTPNSSYQLASSALPFIVRPIP